MNYSQDFKDFVENGINNFFIGTGNPNGNILIIGKESAIASDDIEGKKWYDSNATDWNQHIQNNTCETLEYNVDENHSLRKTWGKNTWSKYQKLVDNVLEKETEKFKVDFLKNAFATEINDSPNLNTINADKSSLSERKELFKNSIFINNFPVVILACSDYIKNNQDIREIDEIFGVTYDGDDSGRYVYSTGNWFFTHHNKKRTKLVIHTRQLSMNVSNKMLENMGKVIRNHIKENLE